MRPLMGHDRILAAVNVRYVLVGLRIVFPSDARQVDSETRIRSQVSSKGCAVKDPFLTRFIGVMLGSSR